MDSKVALFKFQCRKPCASYNLVHVCIPACCFWVFMDLTECLLAAPRIQHHYARRWELTVAFRLGCGYGTGMTPLSGSGRRFMLGLPEEDEGGKRR